MKVAKRGEECKREKKIFIFFRGTPRAFGWDEADCARWEERYNLMAKSRDKTEPANNLSASINRAFSARLGISRSTGLHTEIPVGIWAQDPGAHRFEGVNDNTEIFNVMRDVFTFPPEAE